MVRRSDDQERLKIESLLLCIERSFNPGCLLLERLPEEVLQTRPSW